MKEKTHLEVSDFEFELNKNIQQYFSERTLSKKADALMWQKIWFGLFGFIVSYISIFTFTTSRLSFLLLYFIYGLFQMFIILNIAHDANHQAISHKKWINFSLSAVFDICGISSYLWRILHHNQHHYCQNIEGHDETLVARGFFRFTPDTKRKSIHRFQHIYFPVVYGFLLIDWALVKDFDYLIVKRTPLARKLKHSLFDVLSVLVGKVTYFMLMIFLPYYLLDLPLLWVLFTFFIIQFAIGLIISLVVQVAHPVLGAHFPSSPGNYPHFTQYTLVTTSDYAVNSNLAHLMLGGLHLHVIHHLYPKVCHTHYRNLTHIVQQTCAKYGEPYRDHASMWQAIVMHYRHLKLMARQPSGYVSNKVINS